MEPEKDIKEEMDNLVPGFPKGYSILHPQVILINYRIS